MQNSSDIFFMQYALELAKKAWGQTHPNPMVGAVIVKNGKIISEGFHKKDGSAHAEINALKNLKESAKDASIYVTLEPCSTKGRTGACTDAILASGISKVVIGTLDPNPLHAGKAIEIFKANNIECVSGILEDDCKNLNMIFNYAITKKEAFLALKYAITANKKIAEISGSPSKITDKEAREHTMHYRKLFPAIGVGVGTLIADNPALSYKDGEVFSCNTRLIFDKHLNSADINLDNYKVFSDEFKKQTTIVCSKFADENRIKKLETFGVNLLKLNVNLNDNIAFWTELKKELYSRKITGLIVEGGAKILSSVLASKAANFVFEYKSEKVFPDSALDAFEQDLPALKNQKIEMLGKDTLRCGYLK